MARSAVGATARDRLARSERATAGPVPEKTGARAVCDRQRPSRMPQESVRGLLAVLGWDRAVLYGEWPDTEKFGSMPRKRAWEGIFYSLSRSIRSQVVFDG